VGAWAGALTMGPDRLARRFQRGDQDALAPLYHAVQPVLRAALHRGARRGLPEALQAVDLDQQSWLILAELTRRWEPRPGIGFSAYLGRTFPWALARYLRAQSPARRARHCQVYAQPHDRVVAALDNAPDIDGRAWDDALYCVELLDTLDPQARAALWLRAVERRSFTDVARLLGVPRASAYDLYRRAVASARRAA
jgi:RNA polymerase sigma factor (sigma-70 family)